MSNHVKSAKGLKGILCRSFGDSHGSFLRVNNEDGSYTDYWISHCDMDIIINDDDAHIYLTDDGSECYIDYSPQTLGKSTE